MSYFFSSPVCAARANPAVAVSASLVMVPTLYVRERDVEQYRDVLATFVHQAARRGVGGGEPAEAGIHDALAASAGAIGIPAIVPAVHFRRIRGGSFRARIAEHAWGVVRGAVRGGAGAGTDRGDRGDRGADGCVGGGGGGCEGGAGFVVREGGAGAGAGVSQVCGGGVAGAGGVAARRCNDAGAVMRIRSSLLKRNSNYNC